MNARLPGAGDLWIDPAYFESDEIESAEDRADAYLLDDHKIEELLGEVMAIEAPEVLRPALLALMDGDAEPLRALLRKRALIEARRELAAELSQGDNVIRFPAHGKPLAPAAQHKPDFVREMPPGWTLADEARASLFDRHIGVGCCIGLVAVLVAAAFGVL